MVQTGTRGVRAKFADAMGDLARAAAIDDPSPLLPRGGIDAGQWDGAPFDRLPPGCPVVPLGVDGKTSYLIDSMGQLLAFDTMKEDGLIKLFRATPNYVYWAWPRWSMRKGADGKLKPSINGAEVKKAIACLEKACSVRGLFDPANRVRGRGAWKDRSGRLIWHAGDALFTVTPGGKLQQAAPGEIDGIFYPRRPAIMSPWAEPVPADDSPARAIHTALCSWSWSRPKIDPLIVLGGLGTMLLGGAMPWRPHVAAMGDRGVGKSELNALIKHIMGSALIDAANATEAGVRQHMGLDALPVAIDEFEAAEDNRRVVAIIELARIACSGGRLLRGGQDHRGVEFVARNAFFCSGINLPPMKPQDLSRFAVLNLDRLDIGSAKPPVIREDWGRMLLRSLMDSWHRFDAVYGDWRNVLRKAGLDGRGQDTYGTLFAVAQLLLGEAELEALDVPIDNAEALGGMIAAATAFERSAIADNWRLALEHLIGSPVEIMSGSARVTLGAAIDLARQDKIEHDIGVAAKAAALAGCKLIAPDVTLMNAKDAKAARWQLLVPPKGPLIERIFQGTRWSGGGWSGALKQAPPEIVGRGEEGSRVAKINLATQRCLVIDLDAYDAFTGGAT